MSQGPLGPPGGPIGRKELIMSPTGFQSHVGRTTVEAKSIFCTILHFAARMDAIFSKDALPFQAASAYTYFRRRFMGTNVNFAEYPTKKRCICTSE